MENLRKHQCHDSLPKQPNPYVAEVSSSFEPITLAEKHSLLSPIHQENLDLVYPLHPKHLHMIARIDQFLIVQDWLNHKGFQL
jgi:hypothetical protein